MGNIYVMSDIHGNKDAFIKMLDLINLKEEDTLYILGDVIDRGLYGVEILEHIRGINNIVLLMGNHEEMMYDAMINKESNFDVFINWAYINGGIPTYKALMNLTKTERYTLLNYVHNLDKYKIVEVNNIEYLLVHAGLYIFSNFTLRELLNIQGDNLLWIRGNFIKSKIKTDYKIVFGHTPVTSLIDYIEEDDMIRQNKIWIKDNKIGIDCGCGFNRKLACLRLNDMKEYYIEIEKEIDIKREEEIIYE